MCGGGGKKAGEDEEESIVIMMMERIAGDNSMQNDPKQLVDDEWWNEDWRGNASPKGLHHLPSKNEQNQSRMNYQARTSAPFPRGEDGALIATQHAIYECVVFLAARCDGAQDQDGVGFNARDTGFGKGIASKPETFWTPKMYSAAQSMLVKYTNQLRKAEEDGELRRETEKAAFTMDLIPKIGG